MSDSARYSADVRLSLEINDQSYPLAKVGPDSFVLRDGRDFDPGTTGTLVITIDGKRDEYHVVLHHGASANCIRIAYSKRMTFTT